MTGDTTSDEAAELSEAADEAAVATTEAEEESEAAPTTLDVICGTMRAKFLVDSWRVLVHGVLATQACCYTCICEGTAA